MTRDNIKKWTKNFITQENRLEPRFGKLGPLSDSVDVTENYSS